MSVIIVGLYLFTLILLGIFSYGFTDPHLTIPGDLHDALYHLVNYQRPFAAIILLSILLVLFACYIYFLKNRPKIWVIIASAVILVISYPAFTYDVFNYITTAKVLYTHQENPYVVMPIEIPHEPYLAFTRAANKVALYGPVWLIFTVIPYYLGAGNIWQTIITFKLMNALVYLSFCALIFKWTKDYSNVVFFALNPLVLLEVIMNGHNDIYMMVLALVALKYKNIIALIASWFVKGATVILTPVMYLRITWEKMLVFTYWLMAMVFFVIAPIREELYPWYAVWLIVPAALLPYKSNRFLWQFTIVLTFALELRNLPYVWMGYYEGPGPVLRLLATVVPVGAYLSWYSWIRKKQ